MRNLMIPALTLTAVLTAAPLGAQTATLVKDINTGSDTASNVFERLTAVGGNLFFTTAGSVGGRELWVSDGTAAGTRALLAPCPGCGSGISSDITFLGGLRNVLLFSQQGALPVDGAQLWRSDGTAAGTFRLLPGTAVRDSVVFGDAFVFVGCTATTACGLWRTDGTAEGTVLVKDVSPGKLTVAGQRLFFPAADSGTGGDVALWSSDGTAAGTFQIKTLGQRACGTLAAVGPRLLFLLASDSQGQSSELWTSDGTSAGTVALKRFTSLLLFTPLATAGGRVYFAADDGVFGQEVWTSDGTPAGTRRVTGFAFDNTFISPLQTFGSRAFFVASDGVHGNQLWSTAGTLESTTAVPNPCTGCDFVSTSTPFAAAAKGLVFPADDGVHGNEPWVTDGTAQGTHLLADLCRGGCDSIGPYNRALTPTPQGVLFAALDPAGNEDLWRTDGTAAGTARLSALGAEGHILPDVEGAPVRVEAASLGATLFFGASNAAGPALWATAGHGAAHRVAVVEPQGPSSFPDFLIPYGDRLLFFTGNDGTSSTAERMWVTQGTEASTVPAGLELDRVDYLSAAESVPSGGLAFFRLATIREGDPLLRTDGTEAGTVILSPEVEPGITVFQGRVFFAKGTSAVEIWSTDGTKAGTRKEFALPNGTPEAGYLFASGADLYFLTGDFDGSKIWRSDGTLAGTQPLADLPPNFLSDYAPSFTRLGSRVLFVDGESNIWSTDGTPAGTFALTSGGAPLGQAYDLALFNGAVYFFGATANAGGLFRTDGTSAGTTFLKDLFTPGTFTQPNSLLIAGGGRLWFAAYDSDHGIELWSSDGTPAGTAMVKDIIPGPDSSSPAWLTFAGGRLFFSAADGVHGIELWQSDGTAAGTRMVQDIAAFASSSAPAYLTVAGDRLYFSADDGPSGRELWSLPLSGPGGCQPSDTALCLGGHYRVEAHWRDFAGHAGDGHAVPLTPDTGMFWFFDPTNVETIVKVLDGHAVNGHEWVFYGALSNVEYTLTVTDTQTGLTRQYYNPPGQLASVGDTHGFGPLGAGGANPTVAPPSPAPLIEERVERAASVPCQPGAQRLCLNGGRFAVTVAWKDFQGHTGQGTAVPLSGDTGTFWFFNAANIELVVKALDGRPVNGHFWLFYGALSNVEYTVTVTDSQTGTMRTYTNPSGRFASVADTLAF